MCTPDRIIQGRNLRSSAAAREKDDDRDFAVIAAHAPLRLA
jgi:hypothetical protein